MFVFKKQSESELWKSEGRDPDPDLHVDPGIPRVLWPLPNSDEVNKQVDSGCLAQFSSCPTRCHKLLTVDLCAASLARPDSAPPLHERGETTGEGEREAQETSEESNRVTALFCFCTTSCYWCTVLSAARLFLEYSLSCSLFSVNPSNPSIHFLSVFLLHSWLLVSWIHPSYHQ